MADVTKASGWHSKPKGIQLVTLCKAIKVNFKNQENDIVSETVTHPKARRAGDQLAAAPSRAENPHDGSRWWACEVAAGGRWAEEPCGTRARRGGLQGSCWRRPREEQNISTLPVRDRPATKDVRDSPRLILQDTFTPARTKGISSDNGVGLRSPGHSLPSARFDSALACPARSVVAMATSVSGRRGALVLWRPWVFKGARHGIIRDL